MSHVLLSPLTERAEGVCELCGSAEDLDVYEVPPKQDGPDYALLACTVCRAQLAGDVPLDAGHWFCLQGTAWSDVPAIHAVSWRLLRRLPDAWATDLADQMYTPDDIAVWARTVIEETLTQDSHGTRLRDGDSVTLIKDLVVKGANFTAKRGTTVKGIRLVPGDPENIEGRVNGTTLVLKTAFLKRLG